MFEQGVGDRLARGERCSDREIESEGLGVDISNVYTTLMSEKNRVAFPSGIDANIVFSVGWVREERLYDEVVEGAGSALDLKRANIVSTSPKSRSRK